ncbi:MAG TPA: UDP-N-acetylmuramate--L-alanine ligase [Candidatus Omnitrophica bacterium]|nr:MAG: UDP-N-acetylmuramate--L-alanine ligase [Omnitrophica WOR_2 bacterium GWA2_53_43]HCI45560.1 UDP-N-acetylmuramate--L-alanine ligase [Candidatus Omnitrophota bacterium]
MKEHYHFIGIGGIGMGALAILLLKKGYKVSGSDLRENQMTRDLRKQGARVTIGHAKENIAGADFVIFSSAVAQDNPELQQARDKKIPVMQRAQLLVELMRGQTAITVAGAHGKTTTTSMISNMLIKAGLRPTTAIGGMVTSGPSGYQASLGEGKYFVAETDESDGSFLKFSPKYSVITNIDFEHIDYFHDWDGILRAYARFIGRTARDGLLIACGDDGNLRGLLAQSLCPVRTYGFGPDNDVTAQNISLDASGARFECLLQGKSLGTIQLQVPGKHNVVNAMACVALGLHLGIGWEVIRASLGEYTNVQRRFQIKAKFGDIWVVDDYAHHPTEIKATLAAARQMGRKRVLAIFQPHRYTRVQSLWDEIAKSFFGLDYLILTDIYAASEKPIEGITSAKLKERIEQENPCPVVYLDKKDVARHVIDLATPGDLVIVLGAGDITYVADELAWAVQGDQNDGQPRPGAPLTATLGNYDIKQLGRIGVLMGGYSSEREISLRSGTAVAESLKRQGGEVVSIDITVRDKEKITSLVRSYILDVAFIALHGRLGEDGAIQSILEEIGVPYTGSGVEASRLALDKVLAQDLFQKSGIQVPAHISLYKQEAAHHAGLIQAIDFYPVVVKPAREGSSIGISLVRAPGALQDALDKAWKYDDKVLIEQYIPGRELTAGILGDEALAPIEIRPKTEFFDFKAKYSSGATEYIVPAHLPQEVSDNIRQTALAAHRALGCADLSRVDFILAENNAYYVLEVNTIPGFTSTSLLPKAARVMGIDFDRLCLQLAGLAYGKKKNIQNLR